MVIELMCVSCGFMRTPAEAEKNRQTGLCFDCDVHGSDGRFDLMSRPDTWDEWDDLNPPHGTTSKSMKSKKGKKIPLL